VKVLVRNNVYWVGKIDWELRKFHGNEYSTHSGTSYNSYLIIEDKVALIDSVWVPFGREFVANLEDEIGLDKIDYIIANHGEPDHSGGLVELLKRKPKIPVYCTANGAKSLKGYYHEDWNFRVIKTGDKLSLGSKELLFVEAPMLHWPDSMFSYLSGDNILFSNDAFGQHLATENLFNDLVDQEALFTECIKYYANILTPFSPLVKKKIEEFFSLKLPLNVICTSHGVIWRKDPAQIVDKYLQWADGYKENRITVIYDTMWNATRIMGENIAKGIAAADPEVKVKLFNSAKTDKNDIITEIFKSKGIVVGSPTVDKGILSSLSGLLEMIKGLKFKGKKAAVFGSYGWSGESIKVLGESMAEAGFDLIGDGIKIEWQPDREARNKCFEYGKKIAEAFSGQV